MIVRNRLPHKDALTTRLKHRDRHPPASGSDSKRDLVSVQLAPFQQAFLACTSTVLLWWVPLLPHVATHEGEGAYLRWGNK